jgi:hypothetical protein
MDLLAPLKATHQGLLRNRWQAEQALESLALQRKDLEGREADARISLERQHGALAALDELINIAEGTAQNEAAAAETFAQAPRDLTGLDLEALTMADLHEIAAERGVALTGKRTKALVIGAITEHELRRRASAR